MERIMRTRWMIGGLAILALGMAGAADLRVPFGAYGGGITLSAQVTSLKEQRETGVCLQRLDYSCGSAALSTLFTNYLGQPYSENEIIDYIVRTGNMQLIVARKGFSLLDLKRFAEAHGVRADGYELDVPSLAELNGPVLVPLYRRDINMRHFVVVRGMDADRLYLADPAVGRRAITREEFERVWNPRVGMVFSTPTTPAVHHTPMGVTPADAMYLSGDEIRSALLATAVQYVHNPSEF
jgi:predicted double-glycine peptidase